MSTSTASTIVTGATTALGDYLAVILPIVIPVVIGVAVLFAGYYAIKSLAHRR